MRHPAFCARPFRRYLDDVVERLSVLAVEPELVLADPGGRFNRHKKSKAWVKAQVKDEVKDEFRDAFSGCDSIDNLGERLIQRLIRRPKHPLLKTYV